MNAYLILACSTCANSFREAGGEAAGWSILFLLAIILPLLGGVGLCMFRIIRRSDQALDPELSDDYRPLQTPTPQV